MKKDLTGQKFGRLTALKPTEKRKRGVVVWQCQCDCGNLIQTTTTDLTCGRKRSCGCWEKQHKQSFGQRTKKLNTKDRTGKRYGRLVALYPTEKRAGTNIIWHCKCDCGKEIDVDGSQLGTKIFSCGCLRRDMAREKGLAQMKDLTGQQFGKLTVLSYVLVENKPGSHWLCQCECGNQKVVSYKNLIQGKTTSCGCSHIRSKGEQKIASLLKQHNIPFVQEKIFENCRFVETNLPARFDFYVDNKYLIEYDGEQHFIDSFYGTLTKNKQRDKIKNQYCKQNNIPLIRIPYTHLNNIIIDDLKLETTKFKI